MQLAGLVISLALIITAVVIVFTSLAPMIFHKTPSGDASGSGPVLFQSGRPGGGGHPERSDSEPDRSGPSGGGAYQLIVTTDPADAQVTVEWTSSDTDVATVDQFGNATMCTGGCDTDSVTITAAAGGQTAQCMVQCTGDGSGINIAPSGSGQEETGQGGQSAGTSGTLAPNTEAVITGASGGLNIRSGPGTNYEAKASTADGAVVTVLEDAGNGWCKIKYATGGGVYDEGYVMFQYLAANK